MRRSRRSSRARVCPASNVRRSNAAPVRLRRAVGAMKVHATRELPERATNA
ncbi:Hypothetical protein A7982_10322 [Minicystis rosea]|nr:Hypothetical protein A7982_10322 [Minicystis rosea]